MFNNFKTLLIFFAFSCFFLEFVVANGTSFFININEKPEYYEYFIIFFSAISISVIFLAFLFEKSLFLFKIILNFVTIFYIKILIFLFAGYNILGNFWFLIFERRSSIEEKKNVFDSITESLVNLKMDTSNIFYKDIPADILNINNIETFSAKLNLFLNAIAIPLNDEINISVGTSTTPWFYLTLSLSVFVVGILGIIVYKGFSSSLPNPNAVNVANIMKIKERIENLQKDNIILSDRIKIHAETVANFNYTADMIAARNHMGSSIGRLNNIMKETTALELKHENIVIIAAKTKAIFQVLMI